MYVLQDATLHGRGRAQVVLRSRGLPDSLHQVVHRVDLRRGHVLRGRGHRPGSHEGVRQGPPDALAAHDR